MAQKSINGALLLAACMVSLLVAELLSRAVYPVSPGPHCVTAEGAAPTSWLQPGCTYRQVSNEYDVLTTITDAGHRVPAAGDNPEVVFLGDSFTFGQGLDDWKTFPYLYAQALNVASVNLGCPGFGTGEQVDLLAHYLTHWDRRPRSVKLLMFAMSSSLAGGNDIIDNLAYADLHSDSPGKNAGSAQGNPGGLLQSIWSPMYTYCRTRLLMGSNLARIIKFRFGSQVRSLLTLEIDNNTLARGLAVTQQQLQRLDRLSRDYGFEYELFLLYPVQDIMRGTAVDTYNALSAVSPKKIVDTAHLVSADPQHFYYAYDGHFNEQGSAAIARFLLARDDAAPGK